MMNPIFKVVSIPVCLSVAACTGSTDPLTATVFDNIANIESGEYDRQIASREQQAQAIINSNNAARGRIGNLESQQAANSSTLASLRGQISAVRAEIANARARLSDNTAASAELVRLEAQVAAVQADASAGGDASIARSELARIQSAVRALS